MGLHALSLHILSFVLFIEGAIAFSKARDPPVTKCSWDNCNAWTNDSNIINVHLIPHTHDDLGWIKTVDQYYFGTKPALVPVGVQYIYNTVIDELSKDPTRRFSFAETGFLTRWTSTHNDYERHRLQNLVKRGQVELIGGGWVQNDEAASHYVDIIDQMELGIRKLDQLFGECGHAQTAWQIDPFGHSKEVANLFAMMGYSSLFFARLHYLEKAARLQNKSLEFIWNTSDDLKTNLLTGAFYQDNYGPPPGFCFDSLCGDDPIIDEEDMEGYNLPQKMDAFTAHVKKQAASQRTHHVMLLMGSDFQYTNANQWYVNLDKIVQHFAANSSYGLRVFYSTPTCYVKALNEAAPQLPTKSDDFFPYASSNHSFWTGYFTSRPTFKGMIRDASAALQLARQLDVTAHLGAADDSDVEIMQRASALAQHHDAVTGTAKENVTRDYERRLAVALKEGETVINDAMVQLASKPSAKMPFPRQSVCTLSNETVCDPIKDLSTFSVTIFNPRGHHMKQIVRIPYYSKAALVVDGKGARVDAQIQKTMQNQVAAYRNRAPFELFLPVSVAPLGFSTYFIDNSTSIRSARVTHPVKASNTTEDWIENQYIRVVFDEAGLVSAIVDKTTNESRPFKQEFLYYEGYDVKEEQTSGAYVFRPKDSTPKKMPPGAKVDFSKGPLVSEARQSFSPWVSQIVRVVNGSRDVEFIWTVGPIPKEQGSPIAKEIVTRYSTGIKSGGVFYTDANGRQMMKRTRNAHPSFTYEDTEPVAANYYPITSSAYLRDDASQLTVLTDRAQGASSMVDGAIDVMLHRRLFVDDHWGVEEALDEPGVDGKGLVATGVHVVQIGSTKDAPTRARIGAHNVFHAPILAVADVSKLTEYRENFVTTFAGLKRPLPPNAHILTLAKWNGRQIILRLEHLFQSSEDPSVEAPVSVDLKDLFTTLRVTGKREVLLAGIREPPVSMRNRENDLIVNLHPMEIRTFLLDYEETAYSRH